MAESASIDGLLIYAADDTDFDSILYGGKDIVWEHRGFGWNDAFNDTASEGAPGGIVTMNFTGIVVLAFAALPANLSSHDSDSPPNVTVRLDRDTPTKVTIPVATETPFFQAGPLNDGIPHSISITIDEATDPFPFALDLIAYAVYQNTTKPQSQTSVPVDGNTATIIQGLLSSKDAAQKDNGPPIGPIVGGVIGGTALIAIVSLVVWYLFIRPRRRGGRAFFYAPAKISDMLSGETADVKPDPYPLMHPTTNTSLSQIPSLPPTRQGTLPQSGEIQDLDTGSSAYGYGFGLGKGESLSAAESAAHQRKAETAGVLSVPPPTTYHADSGVRFSDLNAAGSSTAPALSEVPPTYSEK
ncbi:hypothetical protein BN946_scf184883.g14 [Trametes cinnabarina]|uniref:Uncharacterized protein n=1 Tax=Pycnoporus cinnabarinus TaxID=5643 RepID=A0A060SM02_PYCCI|nr:hypothetical protein BN946_scf184883.g14 [Trametes cinnabarina]